MDPKVAATLLGLVPYIFQILPRIVELIDFARNAPEEMTSEEILNRWVETLGIVNQGNADWEAAKAAREAREEAEDLFTLSSN